MIRLPPTRITLSSEDISVKLPTYPNVLPPDSNQATTGPRLRNGAARSWNDAVVRPAPPVQPRQPNYSNSVLRGRPGSQVPVPVHPFQPPNSDWLVRLPFNREARGETIVNEDRTVYGPHRLGPAARYWQQRRMAEAREAAEVSRRSTVAPRLRGGWTELPRSRLYLSHTLSSPEGDRPRTSNYRPNPDDRSTDYSALGLSVVTAGSPGSRYPSFSRSGSSDNGQSVGSSPEFPTHMAERMRRTRGHRLPSVTSEDVSSSFAPLKRPTLRRMVSHSTPDLVLRQKTSSQTRSSSVHGPAKSIPSSRSSSAPSIQDILERHSSPLERLERHIASTISRAPSMEAVLSRAPSPRTPPMANTIRFPSFSDSPEKKRVPMPATFPCSSESDSDSLPSTPSPKRHYLAHDTRETMQSSSPLLHSPGLTDRPPITERSGSLFHSHPQAQLTNAPRLEPPLPSTSPRRLEVLRPSQLEPVHSPERASVRHHLSPHRDHPVNSPGRASVRQPPSPHRFQPVASPGRASVRQQLSPHRIEPTTSPGSAHVRQRLSPRGQDPLISPGRASVRAALSPRRLEPALSPGRASIREWRSPPRFQPSSTDRCSIRLRRSPHRIDSVMLSSSPRQSETLSPPRLEPPSPSYIPRRVTPSQHEISASPNSPRRPSPLRNPRQDGEPVHRGRPVVSTPPARRVFANRSAEQENEDSSMEALMGRELSGVQWRQRAGPIMNSTPPSE